MRGVCNGGRGHDMGEGDLVAAREGSMGERDMGEGGLVAAMPVLER
jgi:hypothetical protein